MFVAPARALFMDEISIGLDSSTTFQIVTSFRQSVHILGGTTLIALLQPAPETYDLFDDINLLLEGEIVYQGPREHVIGFFESMGFKCPERKGVADFLQEVTSRKDQQQYWACREEAYQFISVMEFVNAFHSFHVGLRLESDLSTPFDRRPSCCLDNFKIWYWQNGIVESLYLEGDFVDKDELLCISSKCARMFRQFLILSLVSQMANGLFHLLAVAAYDRQMVVANTFGAFAQLVPMVLGGFVIS